MSSGTSEIVRRPAPGRSKSKLKKILPLPKVPVESNPSSVPTSDTNELAVPLSGIMTRRRPGAKPKSRRKLPALPSSTAMVDLTNETDDGNFQVVPSTMSDLSGSCSGPAKGVINKGPVPNSSPLPSPTSSDVSLFPTASTAEHSDDKMTGSAPPPDLGTGTSSTRRRQPGRKCNRKKASPPLPPTVHVVYDLDSSADPDYQHKAADEPANNRSRKRVGSEMSLPGPAGSLPKSVKSRGRPKKAKSDNGAVAKKGKKISQVEVFSGAGHSLNSASQSVKSSNLSPLHGSVSSVASVRMPPSLVPSDLPEEKRRAARAALDRYEKHKSDVITDPKELAARRHRDVIKAQARKELEAEEQENQKFADRVNQNRKGQNIDEDETEEAVQDFKIRRRPADLKNTNDEEDEGDRVYFSCSLFPGQVLPLDQMEAKILEFLCERPKEEMSQTSCSIIHSCNKDKVAACVDTLCKILEKIIETPTETKFHKIRINNNVFQTKVSGVVGVPEFLAAAGFFMTVDKGPTGEDEHFYQVDPDFVVISELRALRDTLKSTEPIRTELHRDLQVLMPAAVAETQLVGTTTTHVQELACEELAPEFFSLTTGELRREQNRRTEIAKRELTLRTKKTREQDELVGLMRGKSRVYRYASIRIRFPDGFTIQGTFSANEKVQDLHLFVAENLANPWTEFTLVKSGGEVLSKHELTLAAYNLLPSSILNFRGDSSAGTSSSALSGGTEVIYLKPEVLTLVQGPSPCRAFSEVIKSEDEGNKS